jgi:hypothetical protein
VWPGDWKHRRLEIPDEQLVREGLDPLLSHDENGQLLEALSNAFMSNVGENEETNITNCRHREAFLKIVGKPVLSNFVVSLYPSVDGCGATAIR